MVVPSAERSAERSMTLYGQMSNKGWSRHQCSPFRRCKRSVVSGGVTYLRHCFLPKEHAIALTIGHNIIWVTVNAIPQRTLEGLMAQLSLTSAQLGEKYHGAWFASIFSGMAALMCERLTSSRFNDPPVNLPVSPAHSEWCGMA